MPSSAVAVCLKTFSGRSSLSDPALVILSLALTRSLYFVNSGDTIHSNGTDTEWWVTFYREAVLDKAANLPHGFLAADRSNNPDFERVPYCFPFKTDDKRFYFVLISVHLQPGSGTKDKARRHELATVGTWVEATGTSERDFIVLGDMNVENRAELTLCLPAGFVSLNADCRGTNTNPRSPKPYD